MTSRLCLLAGDDRAGLSEVDQSLGEYGWRTGHQDTIAMGEKPDVTLIFMRVPAIEAMRPLIWKFPRSPVLALVRGREPGQLVNAYRFGATAVMPWSMGVAAVVRQAATLASLSQKGGAALEGAGNGDVRGYGVMRIGRHEVILPMRQFRVASQLRERAGEIVPYGQLAELEPTDELSAMRAQRAVAACVFRLRKTISHLDFIRIESVSRLGYVWNTRHGFP